MMIGLLLAAALTTPWTDKITADNAWREYPRPEMVRADWTCLNGYWDYEITTNAQGHAASVASGKILVPYCFESKLSGVGRIIEPNEKMIYTRKLIAHPGTGKRTLLNFEAVDYRASVFVNGIEAGDAPHEGGNIPFSYDITDLLREGENELKVVAWDPTHTFVVAGGKQSHKTEGCFYTRVSGIWQTVWTEDVPDSYIEKYTVVTDIDAGTATLKFDLKGPKRYGDDEKVSVEVDGVGRFDGTAGGVTVKIPSAKLWTPESPHLYNFTAVFGADKVRGYFGMRKIERVKDVNGVWRFKLNNKFVFPMGTLDQGWWPDGLLTPPSVEACEFDIKTLKDCGYNTMRKHIKVEPRIYYYLCDKLGLLLFQDAPSPAGVTSICDATKSLQRYGMFRRDWKEEMDMLQMHPSIVMWIPYNEGWGQPDEEYTSNTLRWTKRHDPTRLVGGPSGWSDYEGGDYIHRNPKRQIIRNTEDNESDDPSADTVDNHTYQGPAQCKNHKHRVSMLGEFGGLGLKIPGHLWSENEVWGYGNTGNVVSREATQKRYLELMDGVVSFVYQGLGAAIYTQTTDVELEINGLMTYDRQVLKFDAKTLKAAHERIYEASKIACERKIGQVSVADFGKTSRGEKVKNFTLINGGVTMELLDYGARVKSIRLADGKDITIGFNDVASYEKYDYGINAVTGRFANRIANGKFTLDGVVYDKLFLNNGPNPEKPVCTLHGGKSGFADKVWKTRVLPYDLAKGCGVEFVYVSPNGEEGYPGKMKTIVRYYLSETGVWRAEYEASVEGKATVFNLTNHIYFNLIGDDEGDTLEQPLQIFADKTTVVDKNLIPTGEYAPVAGTVFDFNKPMPQGLHCHELDNPQLAYGAGYDHNWVLRKTSKLDDFGCSAELELAAVLSEPKSGKRVELWTNEPGLQMWGGQHLFKKGPDCKGRPRRPYGALALETQHFPDSPNHPEFPKVVLRPGEVYRSVTEYRFFSGK